MMNRRQERIAAFHEKELINLEAEPCIMQTYRNNTQTFIRRLVFTVLSIILFVVSENIIAADIIPENLLVASGYFSDKGGFGAGTFIVASADNGKTWGLRFNDLPIGGDSIQSISCAGTGANTVCAATNRASVASSTDNGNSWRWIKKMNDDNHQFSNVSCSASGADSICVAIGYGLDSDGDDYYPVFAVSTDKEVTWNYKVLSIAPYMLSGFDLNKVSCAGAGSAAFCVAAGSFPNDSDKAQRSPLLAIGINGASTWNLIKSIPDFSKVGTFYDVSCTGNNANPLCVAVGSAGIVTSLDGGNTWEVSDNEPAHIVSCNGIGPNAVCAAVNGAPGDPFQYILVSQDEGNTWQKKTISGLPQRSMIGINAINCSASGICAAVGAYSDNNGGDSKSLLVTSLDGGNSWIAQAITGISGDGGFNSVNCTNVSPANTVCYAVGSRWDNDPSTGRPGNTYPVIVESTDNGKTWNLVKNIVNLPANKMGVLTVTGSTH